MIEYFASLKPIATWRLAVFRFLRFLYWKLPSPVQSYIRSPANRLLQRIGIDKFAYIYAKLTQIPSPVKDYYPDFQPLWDSLLLIIAGMPMDNVGGGQRSAQIAKVALRSGMSVMHLYVEPHFSFEEGCHKPSFIEIPGLLHLSISQCPLELLEMYVNEHTTLLLHMPDERCLPYVDWCRNRGIRIVFEMIDDWRSFVGNAWFKECVLLEILKKAEVVTATAQSLAAYLQELGRDDVLYLPNAAEDSVFDVYQKYESPSDLPTSYARLALYIGSIEGQWIEWSYIEALAEAYPDLAIIMIGDVSANTKKKHKIKNLIFLGPKDNYRLPAYLAHVDFSVLPRRRLTGVEAFSPIKVFESLFMCKPLIACHTAEVLNYPGVSVVASKEEFISRCSIESVEILQQQINHCADTFVSENNWGYRLEKIIQPKIDKDFQHSVSAVILIHNNASIIARCLSSLLLHAKPYIHEVIVVDNLSVDEGAKIVKTQFPEVKLLFNTVNSCASGRNLGASVATGEFLAFFDSDVFFSSNLGFHEALTILARESNIGAVGGGAGWFDDTSPNGLGCVTEDLYGKGLNPIIMKRGFRRDIGYLTTCRFFIKRKIFESLAGFDIRFDPTYIEDTDLSFQIKEAGFDLAFRPLSGMRHEPHQTTSKILKKMRDLLDRNMQYFREKWRHKPELFTKLTCL